MFGRFKKTSPRYWVRSAAQADIPEFVDFKNECWKSSYGEFLADAVFVALEEKREQQIEFWRAALTQHKLFIAEDERGRMVGAAASNAEELLLLYVSKDSQGSGIGTKLLEDAVGSRPATLWVFETNTAAQQFYQQHGFILTGQHRESDLQGITGPPVEVEMARE